MSGRRRQRNTSFTIPASSSARGAPVKSPARVRLEEAPDTRRRVAGPDVPLRPLAVDDVGGAPAVARAPVLLLGCLAAVDARPPVARRADHLGIHHLVAASVDQKNGKR